MHMTANSGTAASTHSTTPTVVSRVLVSLYSCCRWRTIPSTPYSVSNGSSSRNLNSRTCAAVRRKMLTAMATSTSSTHRPMPAAAFPEIPKRPLSLRADSRSSVTGDTMHSAVAAATFGAAALRRAR